MTAKYPKRLTRYYAAQVLWLIDYGTPSDLVAFPPFVQAWVRELRACMVLPAPALRRMNAPVTSDLLATLLGERIPLI